MKIDQFLFPYDLQVSPSPLRRILLIGSCLSGAYQKLFRQIAPTLEVELLAYNYAQTLPEDRKATLSEFDLIYVQIPLRSVVGDHVVNATNLNNSEFLGNLRRSASEVLRLMLRTALEFTAASGVVTLVSNFIVPQSSAASSVASFRSPRDLTTIIDELNEELVDTLHSYSHAYIADVDAIANSLGKQYFLDDIIYMYSHGGAYGDSDENTPFWTAPQPGRMDVVPSLGTTYGERTYDFFCAVFRQIDVLCRISRQIDQVKLVIFDLDNTLWRGEIGEHYGPDQEHPPVDGWPLGVWEAVHHLRWRGILVAVCSKNSAEIVSSRWSSAVKLPFIELNHFFSQKINWRPKTDNIREIMAEAGVTSKSVVFVDDSPVERNSVKAAFPGIRVIGSDPFQTRRILLWSPETQVLRQSDESMRRETMVKQQIEREREKAAVGRDEFLRGLNTAVRLFMIDGITSPEFPRFAELLNKTNQFNTTGKRWSTPEIVGLLDRGGHIYAFSVSDRFSDYGLVGAVLVCGNAILQFVMSCRILGMDIELAVLAHIVRTMVCEAGSPIVAHLVENESNSPCRDVYSRAGFAISGDTAGSFEIIGNATMSAPAHITVNASNPPTSEPDREKAYLARYPDVANGVLNGDVSSGKQHFSLYGRAEGRIW